MKYDRKIIWNYIHGNDLNGYDTEILENDREFMMDVINISNDKKMYNFCSEQLKGDYIFIKYLIEKYKTDIDYVRNLVSNFIKYNTTLDVNEKMEISIMLYNLLSPEERSMLDGLDILAFYTFYKTNIELALEDKENEDIKDLLGMGFIYVKSEFSYYENIMNYFALKFLDEIFYEGKLSLEEQIHKSFKNKELLEKKGINNFLINYLSSYDTFLSNYISVHIDLLTELKKDIERILKRWDFYIKNLNEKREMIIFQELKDFIESEQYDYTFNCYRVLYDTLKELNIEVFQDLEYHELEDYNLNFSKKQISFSKILLKNKLKKLLIKLYKEDYIDLTKLEDKSPSINKPILKIKVSKNNI